MKRCGQCGAALPKGSIICKNCGYENMKATAQNKSKRIYLALFFLTILAGAALGSYFLFFSGKPLPSVGYSYLAAAPEVQIDYEAAEVIYPTLYSTMDSIVNFSATCENGEKEVFVKVEVPGFTQAYEQLVTLSEQLTQLYVRPPILMGELSLDSEKEAQLNFTVTEKETGEILLKKSIPIVIKSKYDFNLWEDEFGTYTSDNFLAWLTPESGGVIELQRLAVDWISYYTSGAISSIGGYQNIGGFESDQLYMNTYYQVLAFQGAMSDLAGIRYNMTSFSTAQGINQRVKLPDETMRTKSGVCIETALLMASAIQAADMHAMIILPPGHAQVAVETWRGSGEYFLIETTCLPLDDANVDYAIRYLTNDEWVEYIEDPYGTGESCYVLNCDFSVIFGMTGF